MGQPASHRNVFTEEITGIHKNSLSVEGKFFLRRLSKEETLHTP